MVCYVVQKKRYQNTGKVKWEGRWEVFLEEVQLKSSTERVSFQGVPCLDPWASKLCSNFGYTVLDDVACSLIVI